MRIYAIKLKNFRGYKNEIEIKFDNLTMLVGKNDVGKSTVLEALDIFFNDKEANVKLDKGDFNREAEDCEICITGVFEDLPEKIIIDSSHETTLESEFLLNEENRLEVVKKWSSASSSKVYIKAKHPINGIYSNLLLKKNTDLKKIISDNNIECENLSTNAIMRKAIWNHASNPELQLIEIDASRDDAKILWDKIKCYLPIYSLFQADRNNSDGDSEIQDPLREAVKQIIANQEIQDKLNEVAEQVKEKLKDVAQRTVEKLNEMDTGIANSLTPQIPDVANLKWADVFKSVSITGENDIPLNKRGSGVRRLVLINFFRAEVERRRHENGNQSVIYAIEEPETSQHTENQKKLIDALKMLAETTGTQVILTTHSAYLVKQLNFSNLRIIKDDGEKIVQHVEKGALSYPSLNEVNYLAFYEISEEYHDELYGTIKAQRWLEEFKRGKELRNYIRVNNDGNASESRIILSEYVRHQIHHPENTHNIKYNQSELRESIELMREFIINKRETEDYNDFD